MNLQVSLQSELLKTKRTASLYLTIFAAAFGPFFSMLDLVFDGVEPGDSDVVLESIFTSKYQATGFLVFPFFIILICTLFSQIEYRNNTWKQVLTSPQTKFNVFFAKFINIQLLIFLFFVLNQLFMLVNVVYLHFAYPSLNIFGQPLNGYHVWMTLVNSYVGLLPVCAIQFWLGIRFRNFIVPIGIGIGLWFVGILLVMQSASLITAYFPYSFHVHGRFKGYIPYENTVGWIPIPYTIIFLTLGYLDFKRRRMVS